jgi:hypothetical protein
MNLDLSVLRDEAELAKLVHEKADTGACGADHFCQRFLADMCRDGLRGTILSEICQKERRASRFSLELNNWSMRSSSMRLLRLSRYAMNNS